MRARGVVIALAVLWSSAARGASTEEFLNMYDSMSPMINYDIRGSCQQGADMSRAKRAF